MEYRELDQAEIKQYKEEIQKFRSQRQTIMWCSVGAFITAATLLGLYIYFLVSSIDDSFLATQICIYGTSFSIIAGIILSILKSALFNRRIRNREILIEKAERQQKEY